MPDDLRGLDLEILQLVIGDRDIAPSLELVSFDDPVTIDGRAGRSSHRRLGVRLRRHSARVLPGAAADRSEQRPLGSLRRTDPGDDRPAPDPLASR